MVEVDKLKICTKCGEEYPATSEYFYKRKDRKYRLVSWCKRCASEYYKSNKEKGRGSRYKREYGINLKDYNDMFATQKGKCKICGVHQLEMKKKLSIDHNHDTGMVRGLLCIPCNAALGNIEEYVKDPDRWDKYLRGEN